MKQKYLLIILAFLGLNISSYGQTTGHVLWDKTIGGNDYDEATDAIQTFDGGYLVVGTSRSPVSGNKTVPNQDTNNYPDIWVVKMDAARNMQWQTVLGGMKVESILQNTIGQTRDSGYIIGAFSGSINDGNKTGTSRGVNDMWIVKLTKTGAVQWQKTYGGSRSEQVQSIEQTPDGGYITIGYSASGISGDKTSALKDTSAAVFTNGDWWVLKLDSAGAIQWQKGLGGNYLDMPAGIHSTFDGGYIAGGWSSSDATGDKTGALKDTSVTAHWGGDFWILKLSATGAIIWQKTIGGIYPDYINDIRQTKDSGYIIGGSSQSGISGDKTEACRGGVDYWIVKLDKTGSLQWQKTYGGSGDDNLSSIVQTFDGGYFATGTSQSDSSGDKTDQLKGGADYWVLKLSRNGNIEWQASIGGNDPDPNASDKAFIGRQLADSNYLIGGWSYSGIGGDKTESSKGRSDFWIVKYAPPSCGIINTTVTSTNNTLTAQATNVTYQWLNCETHQLIAGAIQQSFTPAINGNYAVVLTDNNGFCTDTSACTPVTSLSVHTPDRNELIQVYPNPASYELIVHNIQGLTLESITACNAIGQTVYSRNAGSDNEYRIPLQRFPSGIYIIRIKTWKETLAYKVQVIK